MASVPGGVHVGLSYLCGKKKRGVQAYFFFERLFFSIYLLFNLFLLLFISFVVLLVLFMNFIVLYELLNTFLIFF